MTKNMNQALNETIMKTKFFLFALMSLFLFATCGKKDAPQPEPTPDVDVPVPNPDPNPDPNPSSHSIAFTTKTAKGDSIRLFIVAAVEDQKDVWVDFNDNGKKDAGEAIIAFNEHKKYKIGSQNIKVYGKITKFICGYNQISSLDVSKCIDLKDLSCIYNFHIEELDLRRNDKLEILFCYGNKLGKLDLSANKALKTLRCGTNPLKALDVSNNVNLGLIDCRESQLTKLDVSKNTLLKTLYIYDNNINGQAMQDLVDALPNRTGESEGDFIVIYKDNANEKNKITKKQVKDLKENKNWKVSDVNGNEYTGS